jgi:hypothetical protein
LGIDAGNFFDPANPPAIILLDDCGVMGSHAAKMAKIHAEDNSSSAIQKQFVVNSRWFKASLRS